MSEETVLELNIAEHPYLSFLITQVRAQDAYGYWKRLSDETLLERKYVKTKEQLREIPLTADIEPNVTKDIRILFEALALAFEKQTGEMANVVMEMSHEGYGRCIVCCESVVLSDKHFRDAHRFGYRTLDKLAAEGEKWLEKAFKNWNAYQSYKE